MKITKHIHKKSLLNKIGHLILISAGTFIILCLFIFTTSVGSKEKNIYYESDSSKICMLEEKVKPEVEETPLQSVIPVKEINPSEEKLIALTFDDGPHPTYTLQILDVLKKYNVKATFYILGSRAQANPEIIQRMIDDGHQIGNHTYSHPNLIHLSDAEVIHQIQYTNDIVEQIAGYKIDTFRPTYGLYDERIQRLVNLPLILWNVDSKDWLSQDAPSIYNQVISTIQNHSIVLMHDIYPASVQSLDSIIPELQRQNYQFFTINEYIERTSN